MIDFQDALNHLRNFSGAKSLTGISLRGFRRLLTVSTMVVGTLTMFPASAHAQTEAEAYDALQVWSESGRSEDTRWGLGLAIGAQREPYRDFDNKTLAIPLIYVENRWISLFGTVLDVKLPSAGPIGFRLRARYASEGYQAQDSPFLVGMAERKAGVWLGGSAAVRTTAGNLSAEWLGDASGYSKGQRFKLQMDRGLRLGAFDFTPRLAFTWLDKKYVAYYYGVRDFESLPHRRAYSGDSSVNVEFGLRLAYTVAPRQNVFVDVNTVRIGSSIKESPLVGRSSTSAVRVGYLYRF